MSASAQHRPKVIGIGFGKTGTSSLAACLGQLGYRHKTWDKHFYDAYADGDTSVLDKALAEYDSFEDWPWPGLYRYVDARYPDAKFILTLRKDADTFVRSLETHAMRRAEKTRIWRIYGMKPGQFDAVIARQRYLDHIEEVSAYFRTQPQRLLSVCWETGDGWEKLAGFLGVAVPELPFPRAYATPGDAEYAAKERRRKRIPRFVRKLIDRRAGR